MTSKEIRIKLREKVQNRNKKMGITAPVKAVVITSKDAIVETATKVVDKTTGVLKNLNPFGTKRE